MVSNKPYAREGSPATQRPTPSAGNDVSLFANKEDLERLFGKLLQHAQHDPHVAEKICTKGLIIQWQYENPHHVMTINAARQPCTKADTYFDVIWGSAQASHLQPHVILWMSANTAHRYFLNQINVLIAIAKKEITLSPAGALKQVLELEPLLRTLCKIYPDVLRQLGREDLLSTQ